MTPALPTLTDEEVRRSVPAEEEAGFGTLHTARGHLPLKAMDVHAQLDGLLAEMALCQTFVNVFDEPLEATYIFPLPDRAAVTRFRMEVAGRVIDGVLKERGQARRDYQQAIRDGHRAAITEEDRPGVFTLRVGNLLPGEAATVRLTLTGPLPYSDGEATFRFPLVVAPRYIPGSPLPGRSVGDGTASDTDAVPDASRITPPVLLPGYPNPVRLSLAVEILPSPIPVYDFRSSLHAIIDGETRRGIRRIALHPGERLDCDFILRFRVGDKGVQTALSLRPDDGNAAEGTFMLTVVPPPDPGQPLRPRDVVFVLDRSGSMAGWKMVAARRAVARMVDTLTDRDRFTVYAFDTAIETPPEFRGMSLVLATDRNRFRAVEFLAKIEARGGTEMAQPLDRAVQELSLGAGDHDRILVLITDGQVGNEDQILGNLGQRVGNIRIFPLGIDQAVNEGFLKRLAALGGGSCEFVESEQRLDEVMAHIHRQIGTPLLTGLRLEPAGFQIEADTLVPRRLPDLFAGAPLWILGRYRGSDPSAIGLQACDAAGLPWSENARAFLSNNSAIVRLWARGHVRELEDRFVKDRFLIGQSGRAELEQRIVATSLKHSVLCRFTAFVAVDRAEVVNEGGQVHQVTQPVEMPSGWAGLDRVRRPMGWITKPPSETVAEPQRVPGSAPAAASRSASFDPACVRTTLGSNPPSPQEKEIAEIILTARKEKREVTAQERERIRSLTSPPEPAARTDPQFPPSRNQGTQPCSRSAKSQGVLGLFLALLVLPLWLLRQGIVGVWSLFRKLFGASKDPAGTRPESRAAGISLGHGGTDPTGKPEHPTRRQEGFWK
jgi:Ca-activated chloride channel family protein